MKAAKLTVRQPQLVPTREGRVWLDDVDITDCLRSLRVDFEAGAPTTATMEVYVGACDLDAKVLAELQDATPEIETIGEEPA